MWSAFLPSTGMLFLIMKDLSCATVSCRASRAFSCCR
jgi:hypothetical protein